MRNHRSGFTLVELSIVLVILGLLVGGVLAGQSLIRAAELRAVNTEQANWFTATQAFREKYLGWPGDITNATIFWGYQNTTASCTNASGAANNANGTCDGNGDGIIDHNSGASRSVEMFQYWRQLAFAGMVEGTYTGISGIGASYDADIGVNVPRSKLRGAGWTSMNMDTWSAGNSALFAVDYGNVLVFGAESSSQETDDPILTPGEAWNIDTKVDDGLPAKGRIVARFWNNQCSEAATGVPGDAAKTNLNARYRIQGTSTVCTLYFRQQF